ncbi:Glucose-repressible protein [Elasticomyces elasticus]|uniref:Glucose-repressible protein n=1 Tax=Exophiala sideris TaxID=1016849 RepID=A0ABR0J5M1_9EURO|nr:Glucose-repressible protein [Elasticomyces elasticus]KAK5028420.1 Glucose-repressible protein [Exophiala sideris]KAK5035937.1 Glucose-repressible protein [Exophiala sideris]KAK5056973.1 Glucose-repressible protein [Exophiala sideris]KAK5181380.1 Glucose-repressible protein [Eurotiomycetes sp. CCFEE 6388]
MDTIKNTVNYVTESIQGAGSTASKEANKNVAKDSNASISTRAQAAGDAIGDKFDEQAHDRKADVHREAAKH